MLTALSFVSSEAHKSPKEIPPSMWAFEVGPLDSSDTREPGVNSIVDINIRRESRANEDFPAFAPHAA
jgi:hypothetical protein